MNLRILAGFIAILISQHLYSQQKFDIDIQNLLNKSEYKNAEVGISVVESGTGRQLFELNSNKLMIPASTLKVITSATALEILGPDYRFTTKIGYTGKIENRKLKGNLVVIGGGDPTLGSQYFSKIYFEPHFMEIWARKIKATGITRITGDLILDSSIYDDEEIPPTWIWEDIGNYYGAGASPFTIYDNLFRITFNSPAEPGKQTKIISIFPKIEGLTIKNEVMSSDVNKDLAYVFGSPLDKVRKITGTIPKDRKAFSIKAAIQHPGEVLANEFLNYLGKEGIFVSGKIRFEKVDQKDLQTIYIQESPELSEIIDIMNHESVNLFAEHLLKQIAFEKNGLGDRKEGIQIIQEFWKSKNIEPDYFMEDGSGLSHFNAVSPKFLTSVLYYMKKESSNDDLFFESLPGAGNGTLTGFSPQNFPGNSLKAKSGSMTRVRCYAGYLTTKSGENLVFSIMLNNFSCPQIQVVNDVQKLLTKLKNTF